TERAVVPGFIREASARVPAGPVELVLTSRVPPAAGLGHVSSDLVGLGLVVADGKVQVLAEVDGRYLSNETAGSFTGRVFGVYAETGTVAIDRITYTGDNS